VKREPTFPAFLPLQMEIADSSDTSPSLSLSHSLPTINLAKTKNRSVAFLFLSHGVALLCLIFQVLII
jgi:hypothetical protein